MPPRLGGTPPFVRKPPPRSAEDRIDPLTLLTRASLHFPFGHFGVFCSSAFAFLWNNSSQPSVSASEIVFARRSSSGGLPQ